MSCHTVHECGQGCGAEFGSPAQRDRSFTEQLQGDELGGFVLRCLGRAWRQTQDQPAVPG
jgi:hypothetical protein